MKNIITTLILTLSIGFSSSLASYAYFTNKFEINNDLKITTATFQTEVGEGINTSLQPGESSQYNYFEVKNIGSLNQNVIIKFINMNNNLKEIESTVFYELQIKSEDGEYNTILYETLLELENINIKYNIYSKEKISLRSRIILPKDIDPKYYEQYINLRLKVDSYQINDRFRGEHE